MAKTKFYKVSTLPNSKTQSNLGIFSRLTKGRRRRQLVASVVGVYMLVGGLVGWVLFNNNNNSAQASESALISASLKLTEEREYKLGDNIKIGLTLQNTSVSESLNNIGINIFSTKDSVRWNNIKSSSITSNNVTITPEGVVQLPLLSSGERVEYELQGNVQNNQLEYTNIQAKLKYLNKDGSQDGETNRIRLNTKTASEKSLLALKSSKESFKAGEEVSLTLESTENQTSKGKIYISNRQTQELVSTLECDLTTTKLCEHKFKNLPLGDYSALYIDSIEDSYSNILWFSITGKKADFIPSSQSTLELPTGSASINGVLTVVAKKIISLNQTPSPDSICNFEIYFADNLINSIKVNVENDRSCKTNLGADVFKNGDGIYKIKLANTAIEKEVSFVNKSANLIGLVNKSTILEKGKAVEIGSENILDVNGQPLNDIKVTLGILHTASGEYNEITNLNGENLKVINGKFNTIITPSYLNKGGFYLVYVKLPDGQISDWIALDFEDKQVALSSTNVLFDANSLKIGQNTSFSLENLVDRNGNQVEEGDCTANIIVNGVAAPINIKGQIKKGICNATLPAGKITKSGQALITFSSNEFQNKINQSKQINFAPGNPEKYGKLIFESPVKSEFANNLIIGPVTDKFGNLVDAYNYKLVLSDTAAELQTFPIQIRDGFAQIEVPSSYLIDESITAKLKNDKDIEVLSSNFNIDNTKSKYISANLPIEITNDKNIVATIEGLELADQTECKLSLIKSQDEVSETVVPLDNAAGKCVFDWDLNQNRSGNKVLLQITIADQSYATVATLKSSEPTNLFTISPQIRITAENELAISLLTSPITDKQGKSIEKADLKWQYNGKVIQTTITNGLSSLELPANKLETKDIQVTTTERNLDLDLDVKAGITSISKTNNLSIYIGNYDISNSNTNFTNLLSSTLVTENQNRIFEFKTDVCKGKLLNSITNTTALKTHLQAGSCFVQADAKAGQSTISFENAGFVLGSFVYNSTLDQQDINWCETTSNSDKCMIQVLAPINSPVQVLIKDGDKEYKFTSGDLENTVVVSQNGLNPLKKYSVEVSYKDSKNQTIVQTRQIIGERLIK
jgi:uncharacterized protein YerC